MLGTGEEGAVGAGTWRRGADARDWLGATLIAERDRWPLWAPVAVGVGIGIYFALPEEPHPALAVTLLVLALAGLIAARKGGRPAVLVMMGPVLVGAGLALAVLRAERVAAPVLERRHGPTLVTGRVVALEPRQADARVVIAPTEIARLNAADMPERVRLTVRTDSAALLPGAQVRVPAVLLPPPRPAAPGAYDYARALYFERIGAVGFTVGAAEAIAAPEDGADLETRLSALRLAVAERIGAAAGGEGQGARAEVAKALLTGVRSAIPDDVVAALRDSGLAHLLAISGLHLGLVTGCLFFAARLALAAVEPVALRFPIKKWAALFALVGAFAYLMLTGATVPTQRAFVMVALVLIAVLLDREAVSMRPVALAALVVLALHPESLVGASFQMSFAAVTALVAFYEAARGRWGGLREAHAGPARRALLYLAMTAATTVVASAATGPFAAYHFGRVATVGLVANMVAVPVTALWIMPWGLAGLVLMPIGLEALALVPMAWGIELMIATARLCAGLPGAVSLVPAWPPAALAAISLGGLWLCLWRRRWRWLGVGGIALGLALAAGARPPDLLVDEEGKLFAVRDSTGALALSSSRTAKFSGEVWLRRNGQREARAWVDESGAWPDGSLRCDTVGCIWRPEGRATVALVREARALAEDCALADVVVSAVPVWSSCTAAPWVVDRFDLWRHGAHALWLGRSPDQVRIDSVEGRRGRRPWSARPR